MMANKEGYEAEFFLSEIANQSLTAQQQADWLRRQAPLVGSADQGDPADLGRYRQGRLVPGRRQLADHVHG